MALTNTFASVELAHTPTALEHMPNLNTQPGRPDLWIKRDDCSGKAMAGLISMIPYGFWTSDQRVLFLHTGGAPALFGYPEIVDD